MRSFRDDALLRGVAARARKRGHRGRPVDDVPVEHRHCTKGVLGRHAPKQREWADIAYGFRVAKGIGALRRRPERRGHAGAWCWPSRRIEGTDACIRRGGELGHGGVVVVKVMQAGPGPALRRARGRPAHARGHGARRGRAVLALEAGTHDPARARGAARAAPTRRDRDRRRARGERGSARMSAARCRRRRRLPRARSTPRSTRPRRTSSSSAWSTATPSAPREVGGALRRVVLHRRRASSAGAVDCASVAVPTPLHRDVGAAAARGAASTCWSRSRSPRRSPRRGARRPRRARAGASCRSAISSASTRRSARSPSVLTRAALPRVPPPRAVRRARHRRRRHPRPDDPRPRRDPQRDATPRCERVEAVGVPVLTARPTSPTRGCASPTAHRQRHRQPRVAEARAQAPLLPARHLRLARLRREAPAHLPPRPAPPGGLAPHRGRGAHRRGRGRAARRDRAFRRRRAHAPARRW